MKTLTRLSSLAALSALFASSVSFESAVSAVVVAGFAAIALTDYSRKTRPLVTELAMVPATNGRRERFGLAA